MTTSTKGIILAGGTGTRLSPLTNFVNKQLLPVYDKPMLYYPLSTLMLAGVREITLISSPEDLTKIQRALGNGHQWGVEFSYIEQPKPEGIAQAFLLAQDHIKGHKTALILGDNVFHSAGLQELMQKALNRDGATIFGVLVAAPASFGIVEVDDTGRAVSLQEKPQNPKSNWAIPGLYFYDETVIEKAKALKPSARGELEITDLNRLYMEEGRLNVQRMGRGMAWLDGGTIDDLFKAAQYVRVLQERTGIMIACLEEIALNNGWITKDTIRANLPAQPKTSYDLYVSSLL